MKSYKMNKKMGGGRFIAPLSRVVALAVMTVAGIGIAIAANAETTSESSTDIKYADADGITWTFIANGDTTTDGSIAVALGNGSHNGGNAPTDAQRAIPRETSVDASKIPWTFSKDGKNYTVTEINSNAFHNCGGITGTLTIPDVVTCVRKRAFVNAGFTRLASLGGVTNVASAAFYGCKTMEMDASMLYQIMVFGASSFQSCQKMTGTIRLNDAITSIPESLFQDVDGVPIAEFSPSVINIGKQVFGWATGLKGVLVAGALSGETTVSREHIFRNAPLMKVFMLGRNTKASGAVGSYKTFSEANTCMVFAPENGGFTAQDLFHQKGSTLIEYGEGKDVDIDIDYDGKTIIVTPKTETMLKDAISWATLFRDNLGYSTKIEITGKLEMSEGAITEAMLESVDFSTMFMTFKVSTQAQLNAVLSAVPQTEMLGVDPTGAKEELNIPSDRALWVWLAGDGKYKPKINGLVIVFK